MYFNFSLTHCSLSIMFDEASDITMNSKLNVFVNILLQSGDVKTLTLSLVGILLHPYCLYLYRLKVLLMISYHTFYLIVRCPHLHNI